MTYLSQFVFPSADAEERFLHSISETCFTSFYPFQILTEHEVHILNFDESVTIHSNFQLHSLDDYEQLVKVNLARSKSKSEYVRRQVKSNVREHSNGESAYLYFTDKIQENGFYLLDEPENSLSVERQLELVKFIEESVRFFGCQFIIATHSPFLLSMKNAKIYNLDESPMRVSEWTKLPNVRAYYDFFKSHEREFS